MIRVKVVMLISDVQKISEMNGALVGFDAKTVFDLDCNPQIVESPKSS
jgi:hypothetical protein